MALADPVVITCGISGVVASREQCPAIPYTPAEYAAEARRIVEEGGVHIHIHARRPDGSPSHEIEDYRAIRDAIVAEVGDRAVVNFSTGAVGVPVEKRVAYLEACGPEVAALNMGSLTYAKYSRARRGFVFDFVFANPFSEIVALLEAMRELGIKPEHECFDLGHVGALEPLVDMGLLQAPLHVDFVMGVHGGVPATARNLAAMADNLKDAWAAGCATDREAGGAVAAAGGAVAGAEPAAGGPVAGGAVAGGADPAGGRAAVGGGDPAPRHHWGVIGIGRAQWPMVAAALALGGSVRVGLEDNFYLPDGAMARSNGELVAAARALVEGAGRRPATVEEARALLGLPAPSL
ncbi:MAG TPA: 3-keto-5-aminohexanoate cleavage protein [Solirubrobacteraceae bacterium]|nr:3-keto-5-aminohexanoate cleavage protein [Solirubrobacteraceae bacterium]